MGFVSAKHDLLVHQTFTFNFFYVGAYPIHLYMLGTTVTFYFFE